LQYCNILYHGTSTQVRTRVVVRTGVLLQLEYCS
jgi:hypothetical protein